MISDFGMPSKMVLWKFYGGKNAITDTRKSINGFIIMFNTSLKRTGRYFRIIPNWNSDEKKDGK